MLVMVSFETIVTAVSSPDRGGCMPADNDKTLEVDTELFAQAVKRVSVFSPKKSFAITMTVDKGRVVLSASNPESGSAREEIEVAYNSGLLEIFVNARYLLAILRQIKGATVRLAMSKALSPIIILDTADASGLYVQMPRRGDWALHCTGGKNYGRLTGDLKWRSGIAPWALERRRTPRFGRCVFARSEFERGGFERCVS